MPVNADQLPADVRRRLGLTGAGGRKRAKPSTAGTSDSVPCAGRCGCGDEFPTARAWEQHADATGHRVWAIDLPAGG